MIAEVSASGALIGLVAGLGIWLMVSRVPWGRVPTLDQRLAPYLRGIRPGDLTAAPAHR